MPQHATVHTTAMSRPCDATVTVSARAAAPPGPALPRTVRYALGAMAAIVVSRRSVLRGLALAGGGVLLTGSFERLWAERKAATAPGYGPLGPVLDRTTGLPLLRLPPGFSYASFGWVGDPLANGGRTPGFHDGMAVVKSSAEQVWLVRNHEVRGRGATIGPAALTYDPAAPGGTTTLVVDVRTGTLREARLSLAGTSTNCAGGPTPWHSWLSCEETVEDFDRPHGFVFEVPADGAARPEPLEALGRFVHEAVAIDPATGIVYQTEDRTTAGFYRFVPAKPGDLRAGGRLQMLGVRGQADADLRGGQPAGTRYPVSWVDIDDPLRPHAPGTTDTLGVFSQGRQRGGAVFARLEGCWWERDRVWFTATSGGAARAGQIWAYHPKRDELRLVYESPGVETMDMPDNVTSGPRGTLVVCEDGTRPMQRLLGLTPAGEVFVLAENAMVLEGSPNGLRGDFRRSEWAGAVFHDRWLFVNLLFPGVTFAITGPWERGPV